MYSEYVEKTDDRNNLGHTCWACFFAMGGSNKNYLNLKLLVFIPEMEISELNSLYSLSLSCYIIQDVYNGAQLGLEFCLLIKTKPYYSKKNYVQ